MKNKHLLLSVCIALILGSNVIIHSMVSGNESVYLASTTRNYKIPVEELRLLLKPLIKTDLEVETKTQTQATVKR